MNKTTYKKRIKQIEGVSKKTKQLLGAIYAAPALNGKTKLIDRVLEIDRGLELIISNIKLDMQDSEAN